MFFPVITSQKTSEITRKSSGITVKGRKSQLSLEEKILFNVRDLVPYINMNTETIPYTMIGFFQPDGMTSHCEKGILLHVEGTHFQYILSNIVWNI